MNDVARLAKVLSGPENRRAGPWSMLTTPLGIAAVIALKLEQVVDAGAEACSVTDRCRKAGDGVGESWSLLPVILGRRDGRIFGFACRVTVGFAARGRLVAY